MTHDALDLTLADLIADAAQVRLPRPRTTQPGPAQPEAVIDLTLPTPRETLRIPATAASLVRGLTDYGA